MAQNQISISNWKPLRRGALRGFVTATFPSGMTVHEVSIMQSNGRAWASPPSKPMVGKDGKLLVENSGKAKYTPLIEFVSKSVRDRWSDAVLASLLDAHPGALRDE